MTNLRIHCVASALVLFAAFPAPAQQVPDRDYLPALARAQYAQGSGPVVCVDEAHHNFHTLSERFWSFGELLRRDGFQVVPNTTRFDAAALGRCAVLVISNAQPNFGGWEKYPYPTPSAFTDAEIAAVRGWVEKGGSLLLIADHMPLAGAAAKLAAAFEVEFMDGFAMRDPESRNPDLFRTADRSLRDHPIVRGRNAQESVSSIRTFTGQAFRAPRAEPLLVLPAGYIGLMPTKAWEFSPDTRRVEIEGWLQGAVQGFGQGRAAFFGEAAMFSAQLGGPTRQPMGMNAPGAEANFQLVLNVVHWLTRSL
ncbi:MAG TPA: DUF4350 domain-containing protein [Steroidobacteraceae bacterium]|nr:DUF4350 domain-containing protein [Steroidobacteraceae bacterium]